MRWTAVLDRINDPELWVWIVALFCLACALALLVHIKRVADGAPYDPSAPVSAQRGPLGHAAHGERGTCPGDVLPLRAIKPRHLHFAHVWEPVGRGLYRCAVCGESGAVAFATPRDPVIGQDQARDEVRLRMVKQQEGRR